MEGLLLVAEAAEGLEVGAGGLGFERPGRDGHEAAGLEVRQFRDGVEEGGEFVGGEAVLGLFVGEFDFDEDGEGFVECCCGGVEALRDFEGVYGIDGVEEFRGASGFVGLEGTDEVNLDVGEVSDEGGFFLKFLDAVFSEEAEAGGVGFEDGFCGMDFGDGHEGDGGFVALGPAAGGGDGFADGDEVSGYGHVSPW